MIVLVARYTVKPGQGDAVAAALQRMAPLVKAGEMKIGESTSGVAPRGAVDAA